MLLLYPFLLPGLFICLFIFFIFGLLEDSARFSTYLASTVYVNLYFFFCIEAVSFCFEKYDIMMWVAISILPVDIMCREVLKGYAVIPAAHVCGLHVVNLKILKHYYDFPSLNVVLP